MSTGTWAACLLVIWVINRQAQAVSLEAQSVLQNAAWAVFWLLIVALVIVNATGGLRLRYWENDADPKELAERRRLLWIKHIAFLVVYGLGTIWAWWLARFI